MLTFIKKIIAGQKSLYLGITSVLSLLASFELMAVIMYTNSNIIFSPNEALILQAVTGIVIMIAFVLTLIVNNYIIENKNEEFSIILLSGRNLKQIIRYIFIQFGTIFLLSYLFGFLLAGGWYFLYNFIFKASLQLNLGASLYIYMALFITKIIYVVVLDLGKFIRIKNDISNYMNHVPTKASNYSAFKLAAMGVGIDPDKAKGKIPVGKIANSLLGVFFIVVGFSPFVGFGDEQYLAVYFAISLIGEVIIIDCTVPLLFDLFHNKLLLKAPNWIITLSNFMDLSNVMKAMINIASIIVPIILSFMFLQTTQVALQNALLMCFFILIAAMFLCFILRFMIYLPTRAGTIATLKALGYSKKRILKIHYLEVMLFIVLMVLFPIVMYGSLLYLSYLKGMLLFSTFISLIAIYSGLYAILCVYMLRGYQKLITEVYDNVKYLNQGE